MIEYVFRPSRIVKGERVKSPLFYGRYSLGRGQRPATVALDTKDIRVARAKLRDLVIEKQGEQYGIVLPKKIRETAMEQVAAMVHRYQSDLAGRGASKRHVKEVGAKILRVATGARWRVLGDVSPSSFVEWRSGFRRSARTKHLYQAAVNAFLNWLVRLECMSSNPIAGIDRVETRGREAHPSRAFTADEVTRLLAVCGRRRVVYLALLYTGLRKQSLARLAWADLHLDEEKPYLLARASTTKGRKKQSLPLHPALASALRELRRPLDSGRRVFAGRFPKLKTLNRDLTRARISKTNTIGQVVHFHSFRKTFQTFGVRAGVNQRSAQALLGHTDPKLTAEVYTDVAGLDLHEEVSKLPVFGKTVAAVNAQITHKTCAFSRFRDILSQLIETANLIDNDEVTSIFSSKNLGPADYP